MKHLLTKLITLTACLTPGKGEKGKRGKGEWLLCSSAPLLLFLCLFLLTLSLTLSSQAQTYKTNDLALPFTTVTAAANSNITAFANSGGYTAATAYEFKSQDWTTWPWTLQVNFSCPTVTLAAATFVFGFSVDGSNWENVPARVATLQAGASAASGNNTNVTVTLSSFETNFLSNARNVPRLPFFTLLGTTNGNAATLTINRITIRERY